jgi:predicted MFS family arabinose efflux permease
MLAIGAALGGVVAGVFGYDAAFAVDAASFLISALFLFRIRGRFSEERDEESEHPGVIDATVETVRYARRDHGVLALLVVKGGFGLAAGVLVLLPVFGRQVFAAGTIGFGILMAARGLGALIGPFLGHRVSGRGGARLFPTIALALGVFGAGYLLLGLMPTLALAAAAIFMAHLGGGAQWVLSTYGLQVLVPDRIRGRIFAFDFALITLSLALSSLAAAVLTDRFGPRTTAFVMGGIAIAWALIWWALTRNIRRSVRPGAPQPPATEPEAVAIADR